MDTTLPIPADAALEREAITALPDRVRALAITDDASFTTAGTLLRRIKTVRTTIVRLFAPHITHAVAAHRALLKERRHLDDPLAKAEGILKHKIAVFTIEDAERRAREARERTAAAQEAQAARVWTEVEALEAVGAHEAAADLVTELVSAPPVVVMPESPVTIEGVSHRDVWHYDVIAPELVPREYLTIDHQALGRVVRALKGAARIAGVRVWCERTVAAQGLDR